MECVVCAAWRAILRAHTYVPARKQVHSVEDYRNMGENDGDLDAAQRMAAMRYFHAQQQQQQQQQPSQQQLLQHMQQQVPPAPLASFSLSNASSSRSQGWACVAQAQQCV